MTGCLKQKRHGKSGKFGKSYILILEEISTRKRETAFEKGQ